MSSGCQPQSSHLTSQCCLGRPFSAYGPAEALAFNMVRPTPGHVHTPALSLAGFRAEGSSRVCSLLEEVTSFKAHFLSVRDNFFFWIPGWGQATLRHFLPWSLYLASAKGKGSRQGEWDEEVVAQGQNKPALRLCGPREGRKRELELANVSGEPYCPYLS